jgi:glycosyltransferase involved in cell wall biosynthesis
MRTVLFISYYYPPSVDAGAKRAEGFARYLPEHGYQPIVLTVRDGNYQTAAADFPADPDWVVRVRERGMWGRPRQISATVGPLLQATSRSGALLRRAYGELFYVPDAFRAFHAPALEAASQLAASRPIDVLLTTSSPYTLLRTGRALRRRMRLPWVADLRDLWVHNHFGYPYSPVRRWLDARLERRWLSAVSQVTTATEGLASILHQVGYGHLPIRCIPNGFFDPPAAGTADGRGDTSPVLQICYTGTLHDRGGHTAAAFLAALARLREAGPAAVQATFYGAVDSGFAGQLDGLRLGSMVSFGGRLTRQDAQRRQQEADVLLLLLPDTPEQRVTLCSKTFDYLAARRAILALVPQAGENAALLRQVGVTRIFAPSDTEGIVRALADMAESKRRLGHVPPEGDPDKIGAFHYRQLAGRLARVLDAAIESP